MAQIAFYRQHRRDGAVRTGVDIDGDRIASRLDTSRASGETDPTLDWYVDVVVRGAAVPATAKSAIVWLEKYEVPIRKAIEALAASVPAGIDPGEWPIRHAFKIGAATGTIACSAARRASARRLATALREVAEHWQANLDELALPQKV